jgi:dTMP kinase
MTPRRSSDRKHGLFVSIDGPGGAGETTIVRHLAQMLVASGEHVHVTAEPSTSAIGQLASELTPAVTGHALACLYAADRYHHVEAEIRPRLRDGDIVISDRYLASRFPRRPNSSRYASAPRTGRPAVNWPTWWTSSSIRAGTGA